MIHLEFNGLLIQLWKTQLKASGVLHEHAPGPTLLQWRYLSSAGDIFDALEHHGHFEISLRNSVNDS